MHASVNTQCKQPQHLTELITQSEHRGSFGGQFTEDHAMIIYNLPSSALSDIFPPLVMIHHYK